ncbi:MAG TPA: Uma2 family endonuclease [Coleofasciculaceae cyanobacterium]|jgi:Uma2 family endonuclease
MKTEAKQPLFELKQLTIPPGNKAQLKNISWHMYETILEEMGEGYAARLAYYKGTLEIRMPLPRHERAKSMIGDLVKVLLEELDIDCEALGSTTFKREDMESGVEPDDCFYIQNEAAIRGKDRIDLTIDPPPDLAIEIDNTSSTSLSSYQALEVPELWRYNGRMLQINVLQYGKYVETQISPNFPAFPLIEVIPQYLEQSKAIGRNATIKAFRNWVRERLQQ